MLHDPWLQRWLPLIRERAGGAPVLELGCGPGADTATLQAAGLAVVALELDPAAAELARRAAPAATIVCQDLRQPWPAAGAGGGTAFGVVLASLSLHYFGWSETLELAARVHAALRPGGLLVCRLNSTEDHHFGASGHPLIEPHYYLVNGAPKRFFDRADVDRLFADGWRVLACEHQLTHKYRQPKALWEVLAERSG